MRTELSLRTCSDVQLNLSLPWPSWASSGVRNCVLVRPSRARFSLSHLLLPSPRSWDANCCPAQEVRLSLLSWLILIFQLSYPPPTAFLPLSLLQNWEFPRGHQVCSQVLAEHGIRSLCFTESLLWKEKVSWSAAFPHTEPHRCFLPLLLSMLSINV